MTERGRVCVRMFVCAHFRQTASSFLPVEPPSPPQHSYPTLALLTLISSSDTPACKHTCSHKDSPTSMKCIYACFRQTHNHTYIQANAHAALCTLRHTKLLHIFQLRLITLISMIVPPVLICVFASVLMCCGCLKLERME